MTGRGNVGVFSLRLTRLRVVVLVACLAAFAVTFAQPAAADSGSGSTTTAASDPSTTSSSGTADSTRDGFFVDVHRPSASTTTDPTAPAATRPAAAAQTRRRPIRPRRRPTRPRRIRRRRRIQLPPARIRPTSDPAATTRPTDPGTTVPATPDPPVVTDPTATSPATPPRRRRHDHHRDDDARRRRASPSTSRPIRLPRGDPGRNAGEHDSCRPGAGAETLVVPKTAKRPLVVHHRKAAGSGAVRAPRSDGCRPAASTAHAAPTQLAPVDIRRRSRRDLLRLRDGRLADRCKSRGGRNEHGVDSCTEVARRCRHFRRTSRPSSAASVAPSAAPAASACSPPRSLRCWHSSSRHWPPLASPRRTRCRARTGTGSRSNAPDSPSPASARTSGPRSFEAS